MQPQGSSPHSQAPATCPYPEAVQKEQSKLKGLWKVRTAVNVYGEVLLALRPTPKMEVHSLSELRGCLYD